MKSNVKPSKMPLKFKVEQLHIYIYIYKKIDYNFNIQILSYFA